MIISASRRTDIPAFYSEWFFNRIKEGFVDVRNPMNIHHVSRVALSPDVVDCIVFWTKDATPMINRLSEISNYKYYFQYTINSYDCSIECGVPRKEYIINNFIHLSKIIGSHNVIWRYDPIFKADGISIEYHILYFEEIAKRLCGYTDRCMISFVDLYKKIQKNVQSIGLQEISEDEIYKIAGAFEMISKKYGIKIQSCSELVELSQYGITHGSCIDRNIIENLIGAKLDVAKDSNQRKECGCVQSIDIGEYNTCQHACKYCYANFNQQRVDRRHTLHDPNSSLIVGKLMSEDKIFYKEMKSFKSNLLF